MTNHLTIHPSWVYDFPLKQVIVWDKCGTPKIDKSYFLPFTEWIFWIKKDKDSVPYFDRNSALFKKNIWSIGDLNTYNRQKSEFDVIVSQFDKQSMYCKMIYMFKL